MSWEMVTAACAVLALLTGLFSFIVQSIVDRALGRFAATFSKDYDPKSVLDERFLGINARLRRLEQRVFPAKEAEHERT
jgi:hypothetical protein